MTPRRTTALVVTVALASGAGGAAVYGLADAGGTAATTTVTAAAPAAVRPAAAVKTTGSLSVNQIYQRTNPGVVDIKVTTSSGSAPTDNFGNPGSGRQRPEPAVAGRGLRLRHRR